MPSKKKQAGSGVGVSDFDSLARTYLSELQREYERAVSTGETTPELSYRPVLDVFFRNLSAYINPEVEVIFEPRKQAKAGRPDWRFYNAKNLGLYGYVEAKGLAIISGIKSAQHKIQIGKYLNLGAKVILTDGIEFIFYEPSGTSKKFSLVSKPITAKNWSSLLPNPRLETEFRDFFAASGSRVISEEGLIGEVAKRAARMSESVRDLAALSPGEGLNANEEATIAALQELKSLLETHHDPSLNTPRIFADFVAQVLAFGLLYAHRIVDKDTDSPIERRKKIEDFWFNASHKAFAGRLRPFRAIIEILRDELTSPTDFGVWFQDCLLLLAHIKLEKQQRSAPDYHTLYQSFVNAFDPNVKFDFGAYVTPSELTAYSVRLTQSLVRREMKGISLYAQNNKLIDPCCGTATFLEHLIQFSDDREKLPFITGFEILPAPYALAHYRLSMLWGGNPLPSNIEIVLTNTLSDELERDIVKSGGTNLIKREQDIARNLCRPPLTLVIGNPPSSDSYTHADGDYFEIINRLIDDFRPPEGKRAGRQNIQKQLNNPFVKFLRWACVKLEGKHPGVLALVLPASFAEKESYKYARKWIAERFPKLWILDLDDDLRAGTGASSLFFTQQGRLLLLALTAEKNDKKAPQIHHASITSLTRQEKLDWLEEHNVEDDLPESFEPFTLNTTSYSFRPAASYDTRLYSRYWPIYSTQASSDDEGNFIFARSCSGIKLAPTSLFFHVNKALLARRSRDVSNHAGITISALLEKWFLGQSKPPKKEKLTPTVREAIGEALSEPGQGIVRYAYRPLLNPFALLSEEALSSLARMKNSGTRARPEILAAFKNNSTFGLAVAPDTKDIGGDLHRFVSFCWYLPDNDLCKRGNSTILCNLFPEYKRKAGSKSRWDSRPRLNINERLMVSLRTLTKQSESEIADKLVFYSYAVLCSNLYLNKFKGALFAASDSEISPRIPIPQDAKVFLELSAKGNALALLEKADAEFEVPAEFKKLHALFSTPFKLTSFSIDVTGNKIELFDDGNLMLSIGPVAGEILSYKVAGYQVLQQWMKVYSHPYTRADFSENEFKELISLLARIAGQIKLIGEIDSILSQVLSEDAQLLES